MSTTCPTTPSPPSSASPRRRPKYGSIGPARSCGSSCSPCGAMTRIRRRRLVRSESVRCEEVAELLPGVIDGSHRADRRVRRHVESCLRCQAELVQYRKLLRALHTLRTDVLEPAPGLLADILAKVEEVGERHAVRSLLTGRRVAYAGAIAAAATAGAAGAVIWASRRH